MGGGPRGDPEDGIQSESLAWAIVISAFAGSFPPMTSELAGIL